MADKREVEHWLDVEGYLKYKEATKLSTEDSKNDPETEPYKSKYESREILLELKKKLDSFEAVGDDTLDSENDIGTRLKALQSVVEYDLALNYIETEEKSTGERYLNGLKDKLKDFRMETEFCSVLIKCYQQLGMLWNGRGEFEKGLHFFNDAEKLCEDYKMDFETSPIRPEELFMTVSKESGDVVTERKTEFENLHTLTLYYISQVYKNIGENEKASAYCHNTLRRQLVTKLYNPADWSVNCATLSQYHLTQEDYKNARHCLACASCVIAECPEPEEREAVDLDSEGEDDRKCRERIPQAKAAVALCWSKYCLCLLKTSSETIIEENGEDMDNRNATEKEEEKEMLRFDSVDFSEKELEVSDKIAKNFEEARLLFLAGQKHLNEAKEFYKLDGHVTNYVEIVQDQSELFKYLACFDTDLERQCKMCKRRVDTLTAVLAELNPQHYLLICRQLIYEIASVYGDIADLKTCIIQRDKPVAPTAHQTKKINSSFDQSAKYFTSYIDSLKEDEKLPEKYDDSLVRVALLAHLYLARAYYKRICPAKEQKIANLKRSLSLYQYVVDYCDRHEDGAVKMEKELQVCREMVELLPFSIAQISQGQE